MCFIHQLQLQILLIILLKCTEQSYIILKLGQGSMLILLHGLGGNAWEWNQVILSLAKSFYVIALEQIGFGDSDKPFLNYRINTFADFLYRFYQVLGIKNASILGHHIGGWTAAALALKHPDLVNSLVLVATNPFNTPKQKRIKNVYHPATCQQTLEQLQRLFYHKNRFVNWQAAERIFTQKIAINVRIAMGGVAHKPWRASEAEKALIGKRASEETWQQAVEFALKGAKTYEHNAFKVELGKRAIVRALSTVAAGKSSK